ncbi:MAG: dephospho-CoA kinase [Solirubrobacterales bacterium]|jgi:dephospho-CoA kinase|nr:dephospho-CoA kinase [Solirubrobacterales bacterium]
MVGLTGSIAAGKTEALAAFARQGAATISSDEVVHGLLGTRPMARRLAERWGDDVAPDGVVDRARVAAVVFADPDELRWLESVLHPLVAERLVEWGIGLPKNTRLAVVEVPLLFETGMERDFDATVAVVADDALREARAAARGTGLVGERSGQQLPQSEKEGRATFVLRNDGSVEDLEREVAALVPNLVAMSGRDG